jgi:PAS domain S-box-containing protein
MLRNLKLAQQGLILVLLPVIFEVVFISLLGLQMNRTYLVLQEVNQSRQFGQSVEQLVQDIYQLAQIMDRVKDEHQSIPDGVADVIRKKLQDIDKGTDDLIATAPDEALKAKAENVSGPIRKATRILSRVLDHFNRDDFLQVLMIIKSKKDFFSSTRDNLFEALNELLIAKSVQQTQYDGLVNQQANAFQTLMGVVLVGGALHVMLAMFLWLTFSRDTADSFRILMDNTRRLAVGQPLNPPLPGKGEIAHLDRVFQDMAQALETARRKERAIIENAIDVICSFDDDGKFVQVSPASEHLFGYPQSEMLGKHFHDLIFTDDMRTTGESISEIRNGNSTGGNRGQFENRVKKKDGTLVDVLWGMQWSEAEQMMFCVAHDITERKEIERMKQEFVAMVSHDLRTPLTSIQGFLTLLETGMYGELSPNGSENLQIAGANISRLIALINDLLDIEKMESGKLKMELRNCALSEVFERSIGGVIGFAEQQQVGIAADETNLVAFADRDRLVQVLINLISNAIKFSPKGSVVRVEASTVDNFAEIRVIDKGRGVPAEYRDVIFERFQQVKSTDATKKGGSGLGLAICKAIVEGHGGKIGVESEEGQGSTFWFRIPLEAVAIKVEQPATIS